MSKGLMHVYTGDGKGKTTASVGVATRALGCGHKVLFVHFLKPEKPKSGEDILFSRLDGITLLVSGLGIIRPTSTREEVIASVEATFAEVKRLVASEPFDLVVLDEMNVVLSKELLPLDEVLDFIRNRPDKMNLILTGRNVPVAIADLADLVTEMRKHKHPYDRGIQARRGLEF
jgi:cob(I)alamin adenosyltransferase